MYQYTTYRANATKTGVAAQVQVNGDSAFLKLAKQIPGTGDQDAFSWPKKGDVRDAKKNVNIKLGLLDIGPIISVLDGRVEEVSLYHEFPKGDPKKVVTSIKFAQYSKAVEKDGKTTVRKGISLSVGQTGEKYGLILSMGDAICISQVLKEAILNQCFVDLAPKTK